VMVFNDGAMPRFAGKPCEVHYPPEVPSRWPRKVGVHIEERTARHITCTCLSGRSYVISVPRGHGLHWR
jgi:hypothetical protein